MTGGKLALIPFFCFFACTSSKTMVWVIKSENNENGKFAFTYKRVKLFDEGPTLRYELKLFEKDASKLLALCHRCHCLIHGKDD